MIPAGPGTSEAVRYASADPEHPGGIHINPMEATAVKEIFSRYASANTTISQLAAWLNNEGFRTRNMHRLEDINSLNCNLVHQPLLSPNALFLLQLFYAEKILQANLVDIQK
ncbi:recombinase family protein [Chloroflexota bacterium]